MNTFQKSVSALAVVAMTAGGVGVAAFTPTAARAETSQTAPAPAMHPGPHGHHWGHRHFMRDPMRFTEGRIAYLKAVLKITPAQQPQFDKLADAMRANTKERMATFKDMREHRGHRMDVLARLDARVKFAQMHAQQEQRLVAAFKPLYETFSPEQKKVAGAVLARAWGHGPHRGFHGHHGWQR